MTITIITVITIITAIIESTLVSFPLTLGVVTLLSIIYSIKVIWPIFVGGLVLDLFKMQNLGTSSLIFLLVLFLVMRFKTKIRL